MQTGGLVKVRDDAKKKVRNYKRSLLAVSYNYNCTKHVKGLDGKAIVN